MKAKYLLFFLLGHLIFSCKENKNDDSKNETSINTGAKKTKTRHYIGKHYGDHEPWEYNSEVRTYKIGDTLVYEQDRYNRDQLKKPENRSMIQRMKAIGDEETFRIIYDSVQYGNEGYQFVLRDTGNEIKAVVNNDSDNIITIKKGDLPFLFTLESVELYLGNIDLHLNFEKDIHYGSSDDSLPNLFRIKVIDMIDMAVEGNGTRECYDIALYSLGESNVGDARIYMDKESREVLKKEYIVYEKSEPTGARKSVGNEKMVSENYKIDITKIAKPTTANYMEAAYIEFNKGSIDDGMKLVDKAMSIEVNARMIIAKSEALVLAKQETKIKDFVLESITTAELGVSDLHRIGRHFLDKEHQDIALKVFEKNFEQHPDSYIPLVGLARAESKTGNYNKAKEYLEKSLTFDIDQRNKTAIVSNIKRLDEGLPMN